MKKILLILILLSMSSVKAVDTISGVVYHGGSAAGLAVSGATLSIFNIENTPTLLPAACLPTGQQNQITSSSGTYTFNIQTGNFLCPAAPTAYQIMISPPTGFIPFAANPVQTGTFVASPACTIDANSPTPACEVNLAVSAPFANTTTMPYFMNFNIAANNQDIINNHIPLQSTAIVPFETTWRTTTANESITIPTNPNFSGSYAYDINWGDGQSDSVVTGDITHSYAVAGDHSVQITGTFPAIQTDIPFASNPNPNAVKLLRVDNWGSNHWLSMNHAFTNAINLTTTSNTVPDLTSVTDMSFIFNNATSANPDTSNWNTSMVTTMESMFANARAANPDTSGWNTVAVTSMINMFNSATNANPDTSGWNTAAVTAMNSMFSNTNNANPNTSNWDTSSVTHMGSMFRDAVNANPNTNDWDTTAVTSMDFMFFGAVNANPDTSGWNTGGVTNMRDMFRGATNANPDTSNWNVSAVTTMGRMFLDAPNATPDTSSWNTISVRNMGNMFNGATNANPDTSNWNTALVNNMSFMFKNATSANPDTSGWDIGEVTTMEDMFKDVTLPTTDYDAMLTGFASQALLNTLLFSGGNSLFCSTSGQAAKATLESTPNNWTITDGGMCQAPTTAADNIPYTPSVAFDILTNDIVTDPTADIDITSIDLDPTTNSAVQSFIVLGEGTWTVDPSTSEITFTPLITFSGLPSPISYNFKDTNGLLSNTSTITLTATGVPPIAVNDAASGNFGTTVSVNAASNDTDSDGTINVNSIQLIGTSNIGDSLIAANEGTWSIASGTISFVPDSGFNASPTAIQYTINDNLGLTSNQATVQFNYSAIPIVPPVIITPPVNIPPVANPDSVTADIGIVTIDILNNDADSDGQILADSIAINGGNVGDSLTVDGEGVWSIDSGKIVFTPEVGFETNPTPINYTVQDNNAVLSNSASIAITYNQSTTPEPEPNPPVDPAVIDNTGIAFIDISTNRLTIPAVQTAHGFFSAELVLIDNPSDSNEPYWRLEKQQFLGGGTQISKTQLNRADFTLNFSPLQRRNAGGDVLSQKNEIFRFYFNDADTGKVYWQQIADTSARTIVKVHKSSKKLRQRCLNDNKGMAYVNLQQEVVIPEISTISGKTFSAVLEKVESPIKAQKSFWTLKSAKRIANKKANCSMVNINSLDLDFSTLRYQQAENQVLFIKNVQLKFAFTDKETGVLYWQF